MSSLLPRQRTLAAIMLVVAALCFLAWLLVLLPHRQRARDDADMLAEKRKSLRQRGWPLDQEKLEGLLAARVRALDGSGAAAPGLKLRAEQVMGHATTMFRDRIQQNYQSPEAFVRNASNIDFREAFDALQRQLAGANIWVAPEVLNLSEASSVPYTYQLLLQVWTLERLTDVVLENHLQVVTDPSVKVRAGAGEVAAARISVQPIVAYYLEPNYPIPYLLGIPIRLRLRGELADVRRFFVSLTSEGNFLPPVQAEIYADDPRGVQSRAADGVAVGRIVLDVTCSAFFAFPGGTQAPAALPAPPKREAVPEGN